MVKKVKTIYRYLGTSKCVRLRKIPVNSYLKIIVLDTLDSERFVKSDSIEYLLEREDFEILEINGKARLCIKEGTYKHENQELEDAISLGNDLNLIEEN